MNPVAHATEVLPLEPTASSKLQAERIFFLGRLEGMVRKETLRLVRDHAGVVLSQPDATMTCLVLAEDIADLDAWLAENPAQAAPILEARAASPFKILRETEFWARIGIVEEDLGRHRYYTTAMLANLVHVPTSAVRRWHRRGVLVAARQVNRLAFFDFTEVAVAKLLAALFHAGCSLHVIEKKLQELSRLMPNVKRPLAEGSLLVEGKRLIVRRGEELTEPGGQLLLDFETSYDSIDVETSPAHPRVALSIEAARARLERSSTPPSILPTMEEMLSSAIELETLGELRSAADMYRAMLAAEPTQDANFLLADVLYRLGEPLAARERYYVAIEMDETFVEARFNLACILTETDEMELAVAAFQGALALQPEYPDAHFHLARTLDELDRPDEAEAHWRMFLNLAPEGPWAEEAAARLGVL